MFELENIVIFDSSGSFPSDDEILDFEEFFKIEPNDGTTLSKDFIFSDLLEGRSLNKEAFWPLSSADRATAFDQECPIGNDRSRTHQIR